MTTLLSIKNSKESKIFSKWSLTKKKSKKERMPINIKSNLKESLWINKIKNNLKTNLMYSTFKAFSKYYCQK